MEKDTTQSVSIANLFSGLRINTTVSSSSRNYLRVNKSQRGDSIGLEARRIGSYTITITATNEAGSVNASFDVTITQASA